MKPYKIINRGYKQWEINNRETGLGRAYGNCTREQAEVLYLSKHPEFRYIKKSHHPKMPAPKIEN